MKFSSLVNVQIENRRIDWVYFLRKNIHDSSNKVFTEKKLEKLFRKLKKSQNTESTFLNRIFI